jgi:nucleolar protein 56
LGAEKALFRALKTKGKTPKYGLIFNSTFIGRAGQKNKGRISRYLANKCAIAARLDSFSEVPTSKFGETLKDQMEERLKFLSTGQKPRKNKDAMKEVLDELKEEGLYYTTAAKTEKKSKKAKKADTEDEESEEEKPKKKKDKKEKKDKKRKARETSDDSEIEEEKPKKKKKKTKE